MPPAQPDPASSTPSGGTARFAERALVTRYVPADRREGFAALLALDDALAGIMRTTREPIVGQMRLTWWYEALEALDRGSAPIGEPILTAVAADVLPHGGSGAMLATMIDGWEGLLSPDPVDPVALRDVARGRGATLFAALAGLLGGPIDDAAIRRAGEGWALADIATHMRDPAQSALAGRMAIEAFDEAFRRAWPRPLRPIGMLALLARADLGGPSSRPGSPRRLARMLMHRIWGR